MQPLFMLFGLLLFMNPLLAQNNTASSEKNDSAKVALCSNAKGEPGFLITRSNGQSEFQTVDQFGKSKVNVSLKNSLPATGNEKAKASSVSSAQTTASVAGATRQSTGRDSSALQRPDKLPPVLSEGPPPQH